MCFLWYFQEYNQTSENIFRKFFWNATKHIKTFSFPENSIFGKYLFSGNAFTRTKRSLIPVYYSYKKFSFTFSNKIFWFFGGKIVFFFVGGLKYNITIVNVFIIFVKFLGLIVAIWMKLARFIEEKGSLRFLERDPTTKIKYIIT